MTTSMAYQITRNGVVMVSVFKGLLIDELAHNCREFLNVFATGFQKRSPFYKADQ